MGDNLQDVLVREVYVHCIALHFPLDSLNCLHVKDKSYGLTNQATMYRIRISVPREQQILDCSNNIKLLDTHTHLNLQSKPFLLGY